MTEIPSNAAPKPMAWICTICGYIHYGPEPPDECPVCGAAKELFEHYEEAAAAPRQEAGGAGVKLVIIGAGIAGVSAAEAARRAAPKAEITLLCSEGELPYYRLNLTRYLAGEITAAQLELHPQAWYAENNIQLRLNSIASAVDIEKHELTLQEGSRISYDRLILAVGSRPFVPSIPGASLTNVLTLRTHADADAILAACRTGKKVVCIGGGLLGLETAGGLAHRGAQVTILENQAWLMPRQLNEPGARVLTGKLKSKGITLRVNAQARELLGEGTVSGVLLDDGTIVPADVVVISAGVRSNLDLARKMNLKVNLGILVDDNMLTSAADVYAAGDAVEHRGVLYGTWAPAQLQGTAAGSCVVGQVGVFSGMPRSNTLKVLEVDLFNIGRITPESQDQEISGEMEGKYFSFVFRDGLMAGAILLGDAALDACVRKVIEEKYDFTEMLVKKPSLEQMLKILEQILLNNH